MIEIANVAHKNARMSTLFSRVYDAVVVIRYELKKNRNGKRKFILHTLKDRRKTHTSSRKNKLITSIFH